MKSSAPSPAHRPERLHGHRRGHDQVRHPLRAGQLPRRDGLLQPVHRQGPHRASGAGGEQRIWPHHLHRRHRGAEEEHKFNSCS